MEDADLRAATAGNPCFLHACALAEDGNVYCWGAGGLVMGARPRTVTCVNRSPAWRGVPCEPMPAPVPGLPRLTPPRAPADERA